MRREDKAYAAYKEAPSETTEAALFNTLRAAAREQVIRRLREEDDELISDIASDVFLKADQFDGASNFSTWSYRLIANAIGMELRRRRRAFPTTEAEPKEDDVFQDAGMELRMHLWDVVNRLPSEDRELLEARANEEPFEEIAARLEVSESAARQRWFRLRERLKGQLRSATGRQRKALQVILRWLRVKIQCEEVNQ